MYFTIVSQGSRIPKSNLNLLVATKTPQQIAPSLGRGAIFADAMVRIDFFKSRLYLVLSGTGMFNVEVTVVSIFLGKNPYHACIDSHHKIGHTQ